MLFKYSLPFAELSLKYSYTFFKPKGKLSRCLALSTIWGGGGGGGGRGDCHYSHTGTQTWHKQGIYVLNTRFIDHMSGLVVVS